jgi:hypothetical protein
MSIFKKTVFVVKKAAAFLFESVAALLIFLRPRGGPSATTIKGETINRMSKEEYEWFLWLEGMR